MRIEVVRTVEEAGQTLTLRRRDGAHEVLLGNVVLLSSAALETERHFGRLAREISPAGAPPRRVLIGGLGFGATLRGALEVAAPDAEVTVVEKLATVEAWVRGELAELAQGALADPRARVDRRDVWDALSEARDLDAILLDVDNGPEWASFRSNARLYAPAGLELAKNALRPGGSLAVWSGYPADAFVARLRASGLAARVIPMEEEGVLRARAYVGTRG